MRKWFCGCVSLCVWKCSQVRGENQAGEKSGHLSSNGCRSRDFYSHFGFRGGCEMEVVFMGMGMTLMCGSILSLHSLAFKR